MTRLRHVTITPPILLNIKIELWLLTIKSWAFVISQANNSHMTNITLIHQLWFLLQNYSTEFKLHKKVPSSEECFQTPFILYGWEMAQLRCQWDSYTKILKNLEAILCWHLHDQEDTLVIGRHLPVQLKRIPSHVISWRFPQQYL